MTVQNYTADFWKIPVIRNAKKPFCKWINETHFKTIDKHKHNIGILTGTINNLLVVDVDLKGDGIVEMQKYTEEFGDIDTFTVKTPGGGYHMYFNYQSPNEHDAFFIKQYLKNKTHFRGTGIDVRSNGGYIVGAGSSINGKTYAITKNVPIIDIPASLLYWLVVAPTKQPKQHSPKTKQQTTTTTHTYEYCITDDAIINILDKLPSTFLDNYSDWLKVSTAPRRHDKLELWETWCKKSSKYNAERNMLTWNSIQGILDINYLVWELNKTGHDIDLIERYRPYEPITSDIGIRKIIFNHKYVYDKRQEASTYNYKLFDQHSTTIIKSCTGTGKTTAIASHMERHLKANKRAKFLSITTRTTLSDQHMLSFKAIGMKDYRDFKTNIYDADGLTICLNSLCKLSMLEQEDLKDYVIYIDEVSSFLELTHNDTLDKRLKEIFGYILHFVKHAGKVIVSDALINDAVFDLLKHRDKDKTIFIQNDFQKYEGIPAIRLRDESQFLDKLKEHCGTDQFFLFGCDSATIVTTFYNACMEANPDVARSKFLLITADQNEAITNASEQFKNKFVFYSPKITFGIDFTIDEKQDVFIYIKGASIQPSGMFQQTTRCRNIRTVFYYGECNTENARYHSLAHLKEDVKDNIKNCKELVDVCTHIDEDDEMVVTENSFFKLYCYNEYVRDIYGTNKVKHYENLLEENGFKIQTNTDKPTRLNTQKKQEIISITHNINEELFTEFLTTEDQQQDKFKALRDNIAYLNLPNDTEILNKYKDIVRDKFKIEEHNMIMRVLRSDDVIQNKIEAARYNTFNVKVMYNSFYKIQVLRQFEQTYDIGFLDPTSTAKDAVVMDDSEYKKIKLLFRTEKEKPKNYTDLMQLYVSMLKNLTSTRIVSSKRVMVNKERTTTYTLNKTLIAEHLEIHKYKNKRMKGFHPCAIMLFDIEGTPEEQSVLDCFLD